RDRSTVTLDDRPRWRILVPVADNDGLVFTDGHRKKFDDRVLKVSGGSTENPWSNGKWRKGRRLYKEPMIPLEFHATTEQAFGIAAFARGHYNQDEIELKQIAGPVYRIRRADEAKPSKLLARVGKAIRRGIRRIGREFFAVLQGSQENGRRPGEGSRHQEMGSGLVDAATAQAESACRQTEGRDHEARRRRGLSVAGNRHRTSTKAAKRRRPR
ncbi:MAG: hypothetical protein WA603_10565, partial [Candidatus Acidiferrales bacterium]